VLMGFLAMQVFVYQIHGTFESIDVEQLNRLKHSIDRSNDDLPPCLTSFAAWCAHRDLGATLPHLDRLVECPRLPNSIWSGVALCGPGNKRSRRSCIWTRRVPPCRRPRGPVDGIGDWGFNAQPFR